VIRQSAISGAAALLVSLFTFCASVAAEDPVSSGQELTMTRSIARIKRFLASEDGPTAVEYAVMLGLIVLAIITIVGALASSVSGTFSSVSSSLSS
jgi:pilus assembly protein Flp/PilA